MEYPHKKLAIINIVGLSSSLLSQHTPALKKFLAAGRLINLTEPFPAVTCTSQSCMLTGKLPKDHGIVANGWYFKDLAEVGFWKQSNYLVQSEKVWDKLKRKYPQFKVANLFWWYNMYSTADYTVTPRPHYPADGRKVFDVYSEPADLSGELKKELGDFPFPSFWGPMAGIASSQWIAQSAMKTFEKYQPHLNLVYLPHLDYPLQKWGPHDVRIPEECAKIDQIFGQLWEFYQKHQVEVMVVSEYGIHSVSQTIHPNRILRQNGFLSVRPSLTWELLDYGASRAFAVCDHQIAHVYVKDLKEKSRIIKLFEGVQGIQKVLDTDQIKEYGLDHSRSGDIVLMAEESSWFSYYFWENDQLAPDFARTVDIHRKPGYDPLELFFDPKILFPKLRVIKNLLLKKLGFRTMIKVIPLDTSLINGSHGVPAKENSLKPVCMVLQPTVYGIKDPAENSGLSPSDQGNPSGEFPMTEVYTWIENFFATNSSTH